MKKLLLTILFVICFAVSGWATTYNYYFSNSSTHCDDSGDGCSISDCTTQGNPCKWFSDNQTGYSSGITAQDCIDGNGSGDTVVINLKRGETWTIDTDAETLSTRLGLDIESTDPVVNIDAYDSGDLPVIEGTVSDFSTAPLNDPSSGCVFDEANCYDPAYECCDGPVVYNSLIFINKDGCSVKNIKFHGFYGDAIHIGNNTTSIDSTEVSNCEFELFGGSAITIGIYAAPTNTDISNNLIFTGQQVYLEGIDNGYNWSGAIVLNRNTGLPSNNTVEYNVIYDIAGEGITNLGGTTQYNIIGDTGSAAIHPAPAADTSYSGTCTIRYNLITMSSDTTYGSALGGGASHDGIIIHPEDTGSCSNLTVNAYGNVIINRNIGIKIDDGPSDTPWGEVRVWNNTIVDSSAYNLSIVDKTAVASGHGFIYNNASILYDRTGDKHTYDAASPLTPYWTISHNGYWTTGGSPDVDGDWDTNWQNTDTKLDGEDNHSFGWTSQSAHDPRNKFLFSYVVPLSESSLIDKGTDPSGDENLLPNAATFANLPDTISSFSPLTDNSQYGSSPYYEIGAAVYEAGGQTSGFLTPSNINGVGAKLTISNINGVGAKLTITPNP